MTAFAIQAIDHIVLRVQDLQRAVDFYEQVLFCSVVRRRDDLGLIHLRAGASMIDLVSLSGPLGRLGGAAAGAEGRNVDHFCLRIEPFDEAALIRHLADHGVQALGPAEQNFGAEGDGLSLYLCDPDGNRLELKGPANEGAISAASILPMQVPALQTARLNLLPLSSACAPAYQAFYTEPDASRAYGGPLTPGAAWARLASDLGSWQLQGFGVWALQRREQGDVVGVCGFWQGPGWPRELTWWLLPEARGAGLALEASKAAIAHAYEAWAWPEVQTYMNDNNDAARALVLRLGGMLVGRRSFPDGLERDLFTLPAPLASNPD